jgi:hypothetical protein
VPQIDLFTFSCSLLLDVAALVLLSYVFYYRRHANREMTVAISVINITLFALAGALATFTLSLGVGFALFSVISIIRLRSDTAGWHEMAYLLVSLSTGLILGLPGYSIIEKLIYASVLVLAMLIIDSPRLFGRKSLRRISLSLEGSNVDSAYLKNTVEALLSITVDEVNVKSVSAPAGAPASTKVEVVYREVR